MTVKELREKLQDLDEGLEIQISNGLHIRTRERRVNLDAIDPPSGTIYPLGFGPEADNPVSLT